MAFNPCVGGRTVIRAAAATTTSFFPSNAVRVQNWNQVTLLVDITLGAATGVEVLVEFATPDNGPGTIQEPAPVAADWYARTYQKTASAVSAGGYVSVPTERLLFQFSANGKFEVVVPHTMAKYMRVQVRSLDDIATLVGVTAAQGMV